MTYAQAGERLRALRRRRGLSHDRLKEQMQMSSRQHLINIEKGWHKPGPELMAALSSALGEDVESFFEVDGGGEAETDEEAADMGAALTAAIRNLVALEVARAKSAAA